MTSTHEAEVVEKTRKAVDIVLKTALSGNLILTIFTSLVLIYLWSMINGLQVIALTCLFKVQLPANVEVVNTEILRFAAFDLFQTEWIFRQIFSFS